MSVFADRQAGEGAKGRMRMQGDGRSQSSLAVGCHPSPILLLSSSADRQAGEGAKGRKGEGGRRRRQKSESPAVGFILRLFVRLRSCFCCPLTPGCEIAPASS